MNLDVNGSSKNRVCICMNILYICIGKFYLHLHSFTTFYGYLMKVIWDCVLLGYPDYEVNKTKSTINIYCCHCSTIYIWLSYHWISLTFLWILYQAWLCVVDWIYFYLLVKYVLRPAGSNKYYYSNIAPIKSVTVSNCNILMFLYKSVLHLWSIISIQNVPSSVLLHFTVVFHSNPYIKKM